MVGTLVSSHYAFRTMIVFDFHPDKGRERIAWNPLCNALKLPHIKLWKDNGPTSLSKDQKGRLWNSTIHVYTCSSHFKYNTFI